ncbi:hypothetical protein F5I97DRAFT_703614 [Phlebopus sp. FC_14]|nr:hypothetical protein F5I97DRAFT_703614 [Phlebopus sp. FC_14]
MHPALTVEEIQRAIFGHLDPWSTGPCHAKSFKPLAAIAVSCRVLSDAALDILWRTQWSLGPLLLCLPAEIVHVEQRGRWQANKVSLRTVPSIGDWTRAANYARRIRHLGSDAGDRALPPSFPRFQIDPNAFAMLQEVFPIETLLPSLRKLDYSLIFNWRWRNAEGAFCTKFLLHNLREFKILINHIDDREDGKRHLKAFFGAFASQCPGLESVTLKLPRANVTPALSYLVSLTRLRRFVLMGVPFEPFASSLQPLFFPVLEEMTLGGSATGMAKITSSIQSDALADVTYIIDPDSYGCEADVLLQMLNSKSTWKLSLQSISLEEVFSPLFPAHHDMVSIRLFVFPNLRCLAINSLKIAMDDDILKNVASQLPHLEVFSLMSVPLILGSELPVTLDVIRSFAQYCPKLSVLALDFPIDARSIPQEPPVPMMADVGQRFKTRLTISINCSSPLHDSEAVASFLLAVLPRRAFALQFTVDCPLRFSKEWRKAKHLVSRRLEVGN